jgi:hypothetical protein
MNCGIFFSLQPGGKNMADAPAGVQIGISQEEHEAAFSGPAVLANRFFVHRGQMVRIAFAEQSAENKVPMFRTAVALTLTDAVALGIVLKTLLADIEKQMAELQAAQATQSDQSAAPVAKDG